MSERPLHLYIIPIHQSLCSANCTISVEATEGQDSRAALRAFSVCPCQLEFAVALAGCIQTQDDGISSARVCMSVCCQGKFRSILFIYDLPAVVRMRRCNVCKCVCVSQEKLFMFSCHPLHPLLPVRFSAQASFSSRASFIHASGPLMPFSAGSRALLFKN